MKAELKKLQKLFRKRLTMEYVRKNRDIKLATAEARKNYLVPEPNYHTKKKNSDNLLAIEMKRARTLTKKPACSGLPILEISKIVVREFWYD